MTGRVEEYQQALAWLSNEPGQSRRRRWAQEQTKRGGGGGDEDEVVGTTAAGQERREKLSEDTDDLLDEIDDVLRKTLRTLSVRTSQKGGQ